MLAYRTMQSFSIWRAGGELLHFRATVDAREKVVLDHGIVELNP